MPDLASFILDLPEFQKNRIPSLYSDFSVLRTTNPSGYRANYTAWKRALSLATSCGLTNDKGDRFVLELNDALPSALATSQWGRPQALGSVVGEAVAKKEFYPLDPFLAQKECIYVRTWTSTILHWVLTQAGLRASPADKMKSGQFVVIKNVENAAKNILAQLAKHPNNQVSLVFTPALFAAEFCPNFSQTDVNILLSYIARDLRAAVFDGETVRFAPEHAAAEPAPLTEADASIASLKSLLHSLNARIEILNATILTASEKARSYLALVPQNRISASAALRSRKVAENALATASDSVHKLENVLQNLEKAADNIELVKVLEKSSDVLKGMNKEVGGVERVDEIMDGLKEQMEDVEQIGRVLGEVGQAVDEDEVEDELEIMMADEEEKREEEAREEEVKRIKEAERRMRLVELRKKRAEEKERVQLDREKGDLEATTEIDDGDKLSQTMEELAFTSTLQEGLAKSDAGVDGTEASGSRERRPIPA